VAKRKFYVVWNGFQPGIYHSWSECEVQIKGYTGAIYMAFDDLQMAEIASKSNFRDYFNTKSKTKNKIDLYDPKGVKPDYSSICVDAACSGNPGIMEYRGVDTRSGNLLFRQGPFPVATNNIGEFLAIVHGLSYLKKINSGIIVYSDSDTAIGWVRRKNIRSKLEKTQENRYVFELVDRAIHWLKENDYPNKVMKWQTHHWGEIPADFGRK
jgi:ribonuclease HI